MATDFEWGEQQEMEIMLDDIVPIVGYYWILPVFVYQSPYT